jgi:di/tricarboxylate transporter
VSPRALERIVARGGLELTGQGADVAATEGDADEVGVIEGVVTGDSVLIGTTPAETSLRERYQVHLLAISRSGQRITQRLRSVRFQAGDVVVLQGRFEVLPDSLKDLGILPLAERELGLGRGRKRWIPAIILAVAMIAVAFKLLPIAIAFFGAALALLLTKSLSCARRTSRSNGPILVLLGALIPVSEAVRTTGATDLIAGWLSVGADAMPPMGALALIMVGRHGGDAVPQQRRDRADDGPDRGVAREQARPQPDPFLMAVAIGAACDFLTPFGHQCNTLVMGPAATGSATIGSSACRYRSLSLWSACPPSR